MTTMEYQDTQETESDNEHDDQPRVTRKIAPTWQSILRDRAKRRMIASQLLVRVEALRSAEDELGGALTAKQDADNDLADLCQDVAEALRTDQRR